MDKPCKTCPFTRSCTPGALGGDNPPTMFIGQAQGPFWLPCHSSKGYVIEDRSTHLNPEHRQCVGAAIYRANIGVSERLPEGLLKMEKDGLVSFTSPEEFLAHHAMISIDVAREFLRRVTPNTLLRVEFQKQGATLMTVPKEKK